MDITLVDNNGNPLSQSVDGRSGASGTQFKPAGSSDVPWYDPQNYNLPSYVNRFVTFCAEHDACSTAPGKLSANNEAILNQWIQLAQDNPGARILVRVFSDNFKLPCASCTQLLTNLAGKVGVPIDVEMYQWSNTPGFNGLPWIAPTFIP